MQLTYCTITNGYYSCARVHRLSLSYKSKTARGVRMKNTKFDWNIFRRLLVQGACIVVFGNGSRYFSDFSSPLLLSAWFSSSGRPRVNKSVRPTSSKTAPHRYRGTTSSAVGYLRARKLFLLLVFIPPPAATACSSRYVGNNPLLQEKVRRDVWTVSRCPGNTYYTLRRGFLAGFRFQLSIERLKKKNKTARRYCKVTETRAKCFLCPTAVVYYTRNFDV